MLQQFVSSLYPCTDYVKPHLNPFVPENAEQEKNQRLYVEIAGYVFSVLAPLILIPTIGTLASTISLTIALAILNSVDFYLFSKYYENTKTSSNGETKTTNDPSEYKLGLVLRGARDLLQFRNAHALLLFTTMMKTTGAHSPAVFTELFILFSTKIICGFGYEALQNWNKDIHTRTAPSPGK